MTVTIGTDPEFFVADTRSGKMVPACGLFGGTKGAAIPIPGLQDIAGFGYQEDNVMLEFNVPPANGQRSFVSNVLAAKRQMSELVRTSDSNYAIDRECSRLFLNEDLVHPKAREFGCSPDFNAYDYGAPFAPIDLASLNEGTEGQWRFAGGHVHLGYNNKDVPLFVAAAFADVFIGLRSVGYDRQGRRRQLYGLPGRFRPTPYGLEYRSLSNKWLFNEGFMHTVAETAVVLCVWLETTPIGVIQSAYIDIPWGDVREAITTEDALWADSIIENHHPES